MKTQNLGAICPRLQRRRVFATPLLNSLQTLSPTSIEFLLSHCKPGVHPHSMPQGISNKSLCAKQTPHEQRGAEASKTLRPRSTTAYPMHRAWKDAVTKNARPRMSQPPEPPQLERSCACRRVYIFGKAPDNCMSHFHIYCVRRLASSVAYPGASFLPPLVADIDGDLTGYAERVVIQGTGQRWHDRKQSPTGIVE